MIARMRCACCALPTSGGSSPGWERSARNGGLLFSEAEINAFNEVAAEARKPKWNLQELKVATE